MFRNVDRQATRMAAMIERLDVDPGELVRLRDGEAVTQARKTCLNCTGVRECLKWLDAPPSSESPVFCANLPLFESLKK